jgi:hypothetical protein
MFRPMLRGFSAVLLFLLFGLCAFTQTKSRHFELNYSFTVRITDPGKPLDVWFPMAQSDEFQKVKVLSKSGDLSLKETTEPEYGNKMFYAHTEKATQPEYHLTVKYDVVRLEHLAAVSLKQPASEKSLHRFLQADKLVPITGKPAELAAAQVKPGMSDLDKGRAFYDYTFATMKKPAPAGVVAIRSGLATPSTEIALTSIRSLSPWRVRKKFLRVLKWDCHCRKARMPDRLPVTTVGRSFILVSAAGSRWIFLKRGSTRRKKSTFSARMT